MPKDLMAVIAENLNYLMEKKGVNSTDIALAINVSQPAVSSWLKGRKMPRADKIQHLAQYFNVSKNAILVPLEERENEEREVLGTINLKRMIECAVKFEDVELNDADREFIMSMTRAYLSSKQK